MSNLLSAEFKRLFKNKFFYAIMIFCALSPLYTILVTYNYFGAYLYSGFNGDMDFSIGINIYIPLIILPVFIGVFIGREYSDGVIRNKLIVGHTRFEIYTAEWIVCTVAAIIIQAVYDIGLVALFNIMYRHPDHSFLRTPISEIMKTKFLDIFILAAYCAIFILFAMIINSRSKSIAALIIVSIVLFVGTEAISSTVSCPMEKSNEIYDEIFPRVEITYESYAETTPLSDEELEELLAEDDAKWREYQNRLEAERGTSLSGAQRTVLMLLDDLLPSSQAYNIMNWALARCATPHVIKYILLDCCTIIVVSAVGILLFKRKDLN